jgi:hypothetical protein
MNDETKKSTTQRMEKIALNMIFAAPYQRPTDSKQIAKITARWNEAKMGMPVVSERDGKFWIVDGNHRLAALRRLNYDEAEFIVLEGLNYEQEADYFRRQNENTRRLTLYTRFKAGLESGDESCMKIDATVRKNGFVIGTTANRFNTLTAIFALTEIFDNFGEEILDRTLALIRETWDGHINAKNREFLMGVAEFISRFGTANFAQRLAKFNINALWQDYLHFAQYQNRATGNRELRVEFCRILVKYYNKGIPKNSRKYLFMEERNDGKNR